MRNTRASARGAQEALSHYKDRPNRYGVWRGPATPCVSVPSFEMRQLIAVASLIAALIAVVYCRTRAVE